MIHQTDFTLPRIAPLPFGDVAVRVVIVILFIVLPTPGTAPGGCRYATIATTAARGVAVVTGIGGWEWKMLEQ